MSLVEKEDMHQYSTMARRLVQTRMPGSPAHVAVPAAVRRRDAGFEEAEVLPIEHPLFRFYRLR
jgi:hypothetical protein